MPFDTVFQPVSLQHLKEHSPSRSKHTWEHELHIRWKVGRFIRGLCERVNAASEKAHGGDGRQRM
jgi:hypothetical protein